MPKKQMSSHKIWTKVKTRKFMLSLCCAVVLMVGALYFSTQALKDEPIDIVSTDVPNVSVEGEDIVLKSEIVTLDQRGKVLKEEAPSTIPLENPFQSIAEEPIKEPVLFTPIPEPVEETVIQPIVRESDKPRIVIVIDDMGLSHKYSEEVVALPAPITLAYLPYAENLPEQTKSALEAGHSLMVHMPMEPQNLKGNNPGPKALLLKNSYEKNVENLRYNLAQFEGYVGFNNHMGSAFTRNKEAFEPVAREAVARGLIFLDSRTAGGSVAYDMVKVLGGKALVRDVFLDHYTELDDVMKALRQTEKKALKNGYAIAIGHPKPNTIQALKQWIPTLEAKGIELVAIEDLIKNPQ